MGHFRVSGLTKRTSIEERKPPSEDAAADVDGMDAIVEPPGMDSRRFAEVSTL